jgi:hypothetical protein
VIDDRVGGLGVKDRWFYNRVIDYIMVIHVIDYKF